MIKKIVKHHKPEILVITPLKKGDKILKETKKSIKRNKTPFEWISYMGDNNPYKNVSIAYKQYRKDNNGVPPYVIKIDNDIVASRYMLDNMYRKLKESDKHIAYAYSSFEFQGHINIKFNLRKFDPQSLLKQNYISSCSLIKTKILDETGGFPVDDKYYRLLDWVHWLKLLDKNYIGVPVEKAHFVAKSSENDVSCGSNEDYKEKYNRVYNDIVVSILNHYK